MSNKHALKGHGFIRANKSNQVSVALQAAEKLPLGGAMSQGTNFSRADNAMKMVWASAHEGCFS
jgi:hypothetical protein